MKLLIVHNLYRDRGGEERYLELIEPELAAQGVEVELLLWDSRSMTRNDRVATAVTMTYNPRAEARARRSIRAFRPDVVHAHNLLPLATPSVLHAAKRGGAKVVLTAHNYRLFCPAGTLMRGAEVHDDCISGSSLLCGLRGARPSWLESVAYGIAVALQRTLGLATRWTDAIIVPSKALRSTLIRAGFDAELLHHIPNGVPVTEFASRSRRHVLYAGRLSPEKGIRVLLAAAELNPHIPHVVAGDGPLRQALVGAPDNVVYVGVASREALSLLRSEAALEILPSVSPDVLPYSGIEALAAGVPVVGSSLGGIPEIARNGAGETVPSNDAVALAAAVERWWVRSLSEPAYGAAAYGLAQAEFSLAMHTARIMSLYERVLAGRPNPSAALDQCR